MALFPTSGTTPGNLTGGTIGGAASNLRTGIASLPSPAAGTTGGASGLRTGIAAGPGGAAARTFPAPGVAPRLPLSDGAGTAGLSGKLRISNDEFLQLRDFIYTQCGIFIAEARKYLVENRLNNRIKALNLKGFGEYYYYLRFDPNRREELTRLFEVITTNETSFWRNPPQLEVFQNKVLTGELDKLRRSGHKKLRIWSAGCSTGEEPYTLAIILHEVLKSEISAWDIKITANDLSEAVLAAARKGVYSTYALRTTPPDITARYFIKDGAGNYAIDPRMKRLIAFGSVNLSDKAMLKRVERSHIIFCRNVIIYFDEEMKRQVIESFYDNLLPGGCMLIGHSESLHNISRAFKPEYHAGTIVYRKEG
jgi:chemotaxis protein methyltransferase CheR